tara:strand:- start:423 stop:542 length:120 start_codon:yes stop_codon:yes gene_type:complete
MKEIVLYISVAACIVAPVVMCVLFIKGTIEFNKEFKKED